MTVGGPRFAVTVSSGILVGALTSILGPDFVQHPHRALHQGETDQDMFVLHVCCQKAFKAVKPKTCLYRHCISNIPPTHWLRGCMGPSRTTRPQVSHQPRSKLPFCNVHPASPAALAL